MNREIDRPLDLGHIQLARKQALAADLAQRAVLNQVAAGLDDDNFDVLFGQTMREGQTATGLMGLRQRQRAATRADSQPGCRQKSGPTILNCSGGGL